LSENSGDDPSAKLPETLYHYCGVSAFHGIVKSKELWLSSAYFTNDYSEHKLLIDKAVKRLQSTTDDEDRECNKPLLYLLRTVKVPPHIACFSSKPDLLSQWRAYSEDGEGFSIGFSHEALDRKIKSLYPTPIFLARVSYEPHEQETQLDKHLEEYRSAMMQRRGDRESKAEEAYIRVWVVAAQCKNHGFHEECEYRILLMPMLHNADPTGLALPDPGTSPLQFRVTDRGIISYNTFPFSENAITDIWLGPKNYARKSEEARQSFLSFLKTSSYNVGDIRISMSEATYH
jgi:hypothetical protein